MDVKIERGGNVGVAQQYTDSFIVASGFDATGGEAVAQAMVFQFGDAEFRHQVVVIIAVGARLCGAFIVGKHIEVLIDNLFQRFNHGEQVFAHGDFPAGVLGLGRVDDKFCVFLLSLNDIDAFNGATDCYRAVGNIDVAPFQSANFADAQPCTKADINP